MREESCDVFVLGAGGAGLRAAIEAHDRGAEVAVASKSLPGKSHTSMAEGGLGAALGNADPEDDWRAHFGDTFVEGREINDWRAAERLVREAPGVVEELEGWGCLFDRDDEGRVRQRAFGGHTYRRSCHFGDKTGLELSRTLQYQAIERGVRLLDEVVFTDLLGEGRVSGAVGLDLKRGEAVVMRCGALVLATGGAGQLFEVTSNSWESTGDGYAMAYRGGATLQDMEMVQFHPTGMLWPESVKGKLVTEAVRGEGGHLLNSEGERFMERYAPEDVELAPRDEVSMAIYREVEEGRGTERGGVYLDVTHLREDEVESKLPGMVEQFRTFADVDITEERMEVAPTAHYFMGGVSFDPETCGTGVPGLFVAGEAAGGVHGANRLGTNSLTEIVVFGRVAGESAASYASLSGRPDLSGEDVEERAGALFEPLREKGERPGDLSDELRRAMWSGAGIVRSEEGLRSALEEVRRISEAGVSVEGSARFNPSLVEAYSLRNMLLVAETVLRSALAREESRGAHFRRDHPETNEEWKVNLKCRESGDGPEVTASPVEEPPVRLQEVLD